MDIGGWYKTQDAAGWLQACLPRPALGPDQRRALASLGPRLNALGYDEYAVRDLLDGMDLCERRFEQIPGYVWRFARAGTPAAQLAGFGLIRQPLERELAGRLLGEEALQALAHAGLVSIQGTQVEPRADLYPCRGRFLFADLKFSAFQRLPNHVYEVGRDSYDLARSTPRRPVGQALDLCLGSGVHAILAAEHSQQVTGVDINPRAVEIAGINALVNGVADRCRFVRGDLFGPVGEQRFDLITANTPFVPTPPDDTLEAYRGGGETGEEVNIRLVGGLKRHLNPGGTLALFTNFPVQSGVDYLERVAGWIGERQGWGIALLSFGFSPRELYIELQIFDWDPHKNPEDYRRRFTRWCEAYDRHRIQGIGEGTILIRRLPEGHPGYRAQLKVGHPAYDLCDIVGDWQEALERFTDPRVSPDGSAVPRLHPQVDRVLADLTRSGGQVTFRPPGWNHTEELDAPEIELVRRCGQATLGELGSQLGLDSEALASRVRSLGQRMVVRL